MHFQKKSSDNDEIQKLKEAILEQEKKLNVIEKDRIELQNEVDKLEQEIHEEKVKYRNMLNKKVFKDFEGLEELQNAFESGDSWNISEDLKSFSCELEKIKSSIFEEMESPSVDYVQSIKNFLAEK